MKGSPLINTATPLCQHSRLVQLKDASLKGKLHSLPTRSAFWVPFALFCLPEHVCCLLGQMLWPTCQHVCLTRVAEQGQDSCKAITCLCIQPCKHHLHFFCIVIIHILFIS